MDLDVTNVNDTLEIAVETTQKVVYAISFAAGAVTALAVEHTVIPKVVGSVKRRRAAKKAAKNES